MTLKGSQIVLWFVFHGMALRCKGCSVGGEGTQRHLNLKEGHLFEPSRADILWYY